MKKFPFLFLVALSALVLASTCDTGGGGGGGGFMSSGDMDIETETWDTLFFSLSELPCDSGLIGSGAGINEAIPAAYFPGVSMENTEGQAVSGTIPEVHIVSYMEMPPLQQIPPVETTFAPVAAVMPGDTVFVKFTFMAMADGKDGDYFLVRFIDGNRFVVPVVRRFAGMTKGAPTTIRHTYTATSEGLALMFIVGLSSPADVFYLDDVTIRVAGTTIAEDGFEGGDPYYITPVSPMEQAESLDAASAIVVPVFPSIYRIPLFPSSPAGSVTISDTLVKQGLSLKFTGGRSFEAYGNAASTDGFSGQMVNFTGNDLVNTYFSQSMMMKNGPVFVGDYLGVDNVTVPTCGEEGGAVVSVNATGNADLSGWWDLYVLAECEEEGLFIANLDGSQALYSANPFYVMRSGIIFQGFGMQTVFGESISSILGLSVGRAGLIMMDGAQFIGVYNGQTGTFSGQVSGYLPVGGGTCTIKQGSFTAVISKEPFNGPG